MRSNSLPNLYLLGPAKTGTTSLAYWLSQHPDIFVAQPKETRYFEFEYDRSLDYYRDKYLRHQNGEQYICDASPMNFTVGYVAPRIKEVSPDAKFIVICRDPYERMYSDWYNWASMRPGRAIPDFNSAIYDNLKTFNPKKFDLEGDYVPYCDSKGGCYKPSYIEASLYGIALKYRFKPHFDLKNFLVIDFLNMTGDPEGIFTEICTFLDIGDWDYINFSEVNMSPKLHKSKTRQEVMAIMDHQLLERVDAIFSKDNLEFTDISDELSSISIKTII